MKENKGKSEQKRKTEEWGWMGGVENKSVGGERENRYKGEDGEDGVNMSEAAKQRLIDL